MYHDIEERQYADINDGAPSDASAATHGSAHHVYDLEEAPSPAGSTVPPDVTGTTHYDNDFLGAQQPGAKAQVHDLEEAKATSVYDLGAPDSESDIEL